MFLKSGNPSIIIDKCQCTAAYYTVCWATFARPTIFFLGWSLLCSLSYQVLRVDTAISDAYSRFIKKLQ